MTRKAEAHEIDGPRGGSDLGLGRDSRSFWNAAIVFTSSWLTFLMLFSIAGTSFSATTVAALIAGTAALLLAVIGKFGDRIQGATPFKLVFFGQFAYAVIVLGSVQYVGPMSIPFRPPIVDERLAQAAIMQSLFAVALGSSARAPRLRARELGGQVARSARGRQIAWIAIAVGTFALALRFNTPGELIAYWSGAPVAQPSSAVLLASNLFRPLLPIGLFLLVASNRGRASARTWFRYSVVAVVTVLVMGTYSFNRAAVIAPFVAVLLLSGLARRRLRWPRVLFAASALSALAIVAGILRYSLFTQGRAELSVGNWAETAWTQVQLYGQSPHFTAEVIQKAHAYSVDSLVASLLSPVPGIPDSLRSSSSTAIYNRGIYGRLPVQDQIIPTWAELWVVGDIPLLLIIAILMGLLLRIFTIKAAWHTSRLTRYGYALAATWLSASPFYSFSAIVQSLLYFVLPVIVVGTLFADTRVQFRTRLSPHSQVSEV